MSKDKAKEISKDYADQHTCYANDPKLQYLYTRKAVEFGYHQAEKDLELTWEDMRELYIIFAEVDTEIELCKTDIKPETLGYYQEVLKRFKSYGKKEI